MGVIPIGEQIAQLRSKRGLSVRQLADLCGMDYSNLSKIERGTYNASIAVINKILTALDAQLTIKETMTTLEELVELINSSEEWPMKANEIIERNGWVDETGENYGVCSDGKRRVVMNEQGQAMIVDIE